MKIVTWTLIKFQALANIHQQVLAAKRSVGQAHRPKTRQLVGETTTSTKAQQMIS